MQSDIQITIALLTYNRCNNGYLKESLDAILKQTYSDYELLVVDNHSSDNTAELVMSYSDPRLTYIRMPPGGNPTISYNRSSIMARGKYIIMAHDDDIMEPTMIERHVEFIMKHPNINIVSNNVSIIDESGKMLQWQLYNLTEDIVFSKIEYVQKYFDEKMWLPAPTLLFKRDVYVKEISKWIGTKDPKYLPSGDLWTLFTLNMTGRIGFIADPLLRYRQHRGQESRNVDQGFPMIEAINLFLKHNRRNSLLKPLVPLIQAFLSRFGIQDCCFSCKTREELVKGLVRLKKEWETKVIPDNRGIDTILPFEIALHLFGLSPSIPPDVLFRLRETEAKGGGRRGFRNFLYGLLTNRNLFSSQTDLKRLAIFGSMLNAYLIAESARQAGIEVVGCFDSSPARIGKTVLDIPVYPLSELKDYADGCDAVIISSEHDQEDALRRILLGHLPVNSPVKLVSWKELAAECCLSHAETQLVIPNA